MQFVARAFVPALIAFLIGVGLAAYMFASLPFAALFLLLAVALFFLAMLRNGQIDLLLFGACALAVALGIFRFTLWADAANDPKLESFVKETVVLRGVISDEPDVREKNTQLRFHVKEIVDGETQQAANGGVLLIVNRYPEYHYGDALELRGTLQRPKTFSEGDGPACRPPAEPARAGDDCGAGRRVFDYPNYLKAKGISYQIFFPKIQIRDREQGNPIRATLFEVKHSFLERLALALPEPENALAGGILLGGKRSLGLEWTERFRTTGIVHIIVLSGYNMTIVAEWLGAAFLFLGFYGSLAVSAFGVVLFALMTGAGATVVRAAIMALLVLLARLTGRTSTMGRALLTAGVLMVAQNPSILAFDPSFQLSFLASLGLVFVAPLIKARVRILRKRPFLEEVFVSTLATQVMVLPLILFQTGILSTVALPANLLVLPLIPAAMFLSFVTGMLGFAGYAFAFLPALPTQALLAWILAVGKYGAALPFAAFHFAAIPGWLVFLVYAMIALIIYRLSRPLRDAIPEEAHP